MNLLGACIAPALSIVLSISRARKELETEIRKDLEEGIVSIPWLILENVTIVEE